MRDFEQHLFIVGIALADGCCLDHVLHGVVIVVVIVSVSSSDGQGRREDGGQEDHIGWEWDCPISEQLQAQVRRHTITAPVVDHAQSVCATRFTRHECVLEHVHVQAILERCGELEHLPRDVFARGHGASYDQLLRVPVEFVALSTHGMQLSIRHAHEAQRGTQRVLVLDGGARHVPLGIRAESRDDLKPLRVLVMNVVRLVTNDRAVGEVVTQHAREKVIRHGEHRDGRDDYIGLLTQLVLEARGPTSLQCWHVVRVESDNLENLSLPERKVMFFNPHAQHVLRAHDEKGSPETRSPGSHVLLQHTQLKQGDGAALAHARVVQQTPTADMLRCEFLIHALRLPGRNVRKSITPA